MTNIDVTETLKLNRSYSISEAVELEITTGKKRDWVNSKTKKKVIIGSNKTILNKKHIKL